MQRVDKGGNLPVQVAKVDDAGAGGQLGAPDKRSLQVGALGDQRRQLGGARHRRGTATHGGRARHVGGGLQLRCRHLDEAADQRDERGGRKEAVAGKGAAAHGHAPLVQRALLHGLGDGGVRIVALHPARIEAHYTGEGGKRRGGRGRLESASRGAAGGAAHAPTLPSTDDETTG